MYILTVEQTGYIAITDQNKHKMDTKSTKQGRDEWGPDQWHLSSRCTLLKPRLPFGHQQETWFSTKAPLEYLSNRWWLRHPSSLSLCSFHRSHQQPSSASRSTCSVPHSSLYPCPSLKPSKGTSTNWLDKECSVIRILSHTGRKHRAEQTLMSTRRNGLKTTNEHRKSP